MLFVEVFYIEAPAAPRVRSSCIIYKCLMSTLSFVLCSGFSVVQLDSRMLSLTAKKLIDIYVHRNKIFVYMCIYILKFMIGLWREYK